MDDVLGWIGLIVAILDLPVVLAWAVGLSVGAVIHVVERQNILSQLTNATGADSLVKVELDGSRLNVTLDRIRLEERLESYVFGPFTFTFVAGVVATVVMLIMCAQNPRLLLPVTSGLADDIARGDVAYIIVFGGIASLVTVCALLTWLCRAFPILEGAERLLSERISQANSALDRSGQLYTISAEIETSASKMGVAFDVPYHHRIEQHIAAHPLAVLSDPQMLSDLVHQVLSDAEADKRGIAAAAEAYRRTEDVLHDTASSVLKTNSTTFVAYLDKLHATVQHANETFIPTRQWEKHAAALGIVQKEVAELSKKARQYNPEREHKSPEVEPDPYGVLGVPREANLEQIKAVYRALVQIYHSDKRIAKDDSRIKKINAAYEKIEAEKGRERWRGSQG